MIRFHYNDDSQLVISADHRSETILDAEAVLTLIAALASRSEHVIAARSIPEFPTPKAVAESQAEGGATPTSASFRAPLSYEAQHDRDYKRISPRQRAEEEALAKYPDLEIIASAAYWADKRNLSQADLQEMIEHPDQTWNPNPGNADVFAKSGSALLRTRDNQTILAVTSESTALRKYPRRWNSTGRSITISGGKRRRYPETVRELVSMVKSHGLDCKIVKSGHYKITDGNKVVMTSVSPSDTNAMKNATRDVEKAFGITLA